SLAGGADGLLHDAVDLAAAAGQSVAGFTNLQQKAPVVGQHAVEGLGHLAHLVGGGHFQVRQGKVAGGQPAESVADGRYRPGDGPGQDQGPDDGHQQAAQGYAPVDEVGAPDGGIGLLPHQDGSGGGVVQQVGRRIPQFYLGLVEAAGDQDHPLTFGEVIPLIDARSGGAKFHHGPLYCRQPVLAVGIGQEGRQFYQSGIGTLSGPLKLIFLLVAVGEQIGGDGLPFIGQGPLEFQGTAVQPLHFLYQAVIFGSYIPHGHEARSRHQHQGQNHDQERNEQLGTDSQTSYPLVPRVKICVCG